MAHPMVPLTTEEMERAPAAASAQLDGAMFTYCKILDPPKADVAAWTPGSAALPRVVRLIGQDNTEDGGFEADVTLDSSAVDIRRIPSSGQSSYGAKDFGTIFPLLFGCAEWREALAKRGVSPDPEKVQVDPAMWPWSHFAAGHSTLYG